MSNWSKEELDNVVYAKTQHEVASMQRRLVEIENQRKAIQKRIDYVINWCNVEYGRPFEYLK